MICENQTQKDRQIHRSESAFNYFDFLTKIIYFKRKNNGGFMVISFKNELVPSYISFLNGMYSSLRETNKENNLPEKSYLERVPEEKRDSPTEISKALLKDYEVFTQNNKELPLEELNKNYGIFARMFHGLHRVCSREESDALMRHLKKVGKTVDDITTELSDSFHKFSRQVKTVCNEAQEKFNITGLKIKMENEPCYYRMAVYGDRCESFWSVMTAKEARLIQEKTNQKNGVNYNGNGAFSFMISDNGIPKKYIDLADKVTASIRELYDTSKDKYSSCWDWNTSPTFTDWKSEASLLMEKTSEPYPYKVGLALLKDCQRFYEFQRLFGISYEEQQDIWQGFYDCLEVVGGFCEESLNKEGFSQEIKDLTLPVLDSLNKEKDAAREEVFSLEVMIGSLDALELEF